MVGYISCAELAALLLSDRSSVAVVDVRDDDYVGGHIIGSIRFPLASFQPERLALEVASASTVVFHCMLSQQRGPRAAAAYAASSGAAQTVMVLSDGFQAWQALYGEDPALTEDFRPEIWRR